jgi:PAS domain S-box-containing protein
MAEHHTCYSEHEKLMRFEKLLSEVTSRFMTMPAAEMDRTIEDVQRILCEFFGVERSSLFQWSLEEPDICLLTHIHQPDDGPPIARTSDTGLLSDAAWVLQTNEIPTIYMRFDGNSFFPWFAKQLKRGKPVIVASLKDLPKEAALDQEILRRYGTKSTALFPLIEDDELIGVLSFASMNEERQFTELQIEQANKVVQVFVSILTRKRTELKLRLAEARLTLASESADADLWNLVVATGRLWTTDSVRKKYGVAPYEVFMLDRFLGFIHPEDREKIHPAIQEAIQTGHLVGVEYRVTHADGTLHWVVSRGRLHRNDAGEPYSLMGVTIDISARKRLEEQLQKQYREIEGLKQRLEQENFYLQKEIKNLFPHSRIVGQSDAMKRAMTLAVQVARTDSTVLILGETGTGKELLARAIHDQSRRSSRPMITVNCASFPPTLIESELFGREKGAYTGALSRVIGRFELADDSTIFLDEIGELPFDLQAKLLRVIEEGVFQRLGSTQSIKVNLRIIAATNRDLLEEVKSGRFRSDLYYRLNVFPILLPPLRGRQEDIPPLVWSLLKELQESLGKKFDRISETTMEQLTSYHWPGNIRELRNVIERAMILSPEPTLDVMIPETGAGLPGLPRRALHDMDREHILTVLSSTGWRIKGHGGAADILGLKRTTLYTKMKKLGIIRPST